jgi:hypothetical protein
MSAEASCGVANPYTCAYRGELGSEGITNRPDGRTTDDRVNGYLVQRVRMHTIGQQANLAGARHWASAQNLERARRLEIGATEFLLHAAPTAGQLEDYTQNRYKRVAQVMMCHPGNWVKVAHVQNAARTLVWQDYASSEAKGSYGRILSNKPNNVVRMMYENFSSLPIFANGPQKHKKIWQLNKLHLTMVLTSFPDARQGRTGMLSQMKRTNSATFLGMNSLLEDLVLSIQWKDQM